MSLTDERRGWPCCAHCDHDPGLRHDGPCIDCKFGVTDFDRQ